MVSTLDQIKENALERGQVNTSITQGSDANVAILHLHRGARINDQEDIDVARKQLHRRLLNADVSLAAIQDNGVAIE